MGMQQTAAPQRVGHRGHIVLFESSSSYCSNSTSKRTEGVITSTRYSQATPPLLNELQKEAQLKPEDTASRATARRFFTTSCMHL